jgi:hypothetical protein
MRNKRGQTGEAVLMIIRLFLLMLIAFSIYFISSLYLDYHLDTNNIEASLLGNEILNCIAPNSEIDVPDGLPSTNEKILDYCGIEGRGNSYILINITFEGEEVKTFEQNARNKESSYLYRNTRTNTKATQKYKPGEFSIKESITIIEDSETRNGRILVEVLIINEI